MLSDQGSAVIRKYGILNTNIPQGHPFYGIPFPGDFLLAADGTVKDKLFLPDYQTRASASEVLLRDFGQTNGGHTVTIKVEDVEANVTMSAGRAVGGQQLAVAIDITVAPGWHIYGQPLPDNYVATAVTFDNNVVAAQSFDFPRATPLAIKSLGETLPVYAGKVRASGQITLKLGLKPGDYKIPGTLKFQECSDEICKLPQKVNFEIPISVEAMAAAAK
jgi:DsbC/DsbD-like thiol-disulfide interchange protein